jgi:hypothetical protein
MWRQQGFKIAGNEAATIFYQNLLKIAKVCGFWPLPRLC